MRFTYPCFLAVLGSISFPALGQTDNDPETAYAFKLEKEADVVMDYDDHIRIQPQASTPHIFDSQEAALDYLDASFKKRTSIVVILGKAQRTTQNLGTLVDQLETQLKKLGFKSIVFELASAEARPIYRIYKKS
jgi:hypothetical protein